MEDPPKGNLKDTRFIISHNEKSRRGGVPGLMRLVGQQCGKDLQSLCSAILTC